MKALGLCANALLLLQHGCSGGIASAVPKQGLYLILGPEGRSAGGPDPARWIDPLIRHLGVAYRNSLLRAAEFHGSSHQAAQMFQVIVRTSFAPSRLIDSASAKVFEAPIWRLSLVSR